MSERKLISLKGTGWTIADADTRSDSWLHLHRDPLQGVWRYDCLARTTYVSEGWKVMRGLSADAPPFGSNEWFDRIHPDDQPRAVEELSNIVQRRGEGISFVHRTWHEDGRWIWVLGRGHWIEWDVDGRPTVIVGTDTDITTLATTEYAKFVKDDAVLRWRVAVESAGQGLWDHNLKTGERYYSDEWYDIRGLERGSAVPQPRGGFIETVHPDDRERLLGDLKRHQETVGGAVSSEYRQKHADGHWIWILSRGRCVERDENGTPLRLIGTDTDITEIKRAQAEHQLAIDNELRWKIAVESADQGVWDINHLENKIFYSDGWRRMRGITTDGSLPNEIEDNTGEWISTVHPDDQERVKNYIARQDAGELDSIAYEFRERKEDGSWMWVLARGKPVAWDENGKPTRVIGTDTDITDLKSSEEELERVWQRLELALDTSEVGIWEIDLATNKTYWDERTFELFGLEPTPDGFVAADLWPSMLHPDDAEQAMKASESAIEARRDFAGDYRILLPNGDIRHVRSRGRLYVDRVVGDRFIGVNWDVSQDLARAEELQRAQELSEARNVELERARQDMEHMSLHDSLTGLPNRRHLDRKLKGLGGGDGDVALLHLDLDRFKQINDTLGHAAGDAILAHTASILREAAGAQGFVARVGGDEFVIVLDERVDEPRLRQVAEHILNQSEQPVLFDGHELRCGVSVGIAMQRRNALLPNRLMINADIALYRAKNEGRRRYKFFTSEMEQQVVAHKQLADEILVGLERKQFFSVYQPQIDAKSLAIVGVEALVRWKHPRLGVLAPPDFLDVAEELSVVNKIDRLVLEQAVRDLKGWKEQKLGIHHVSVNVSARRLADPDLLKSLAGLEFERGEISFELLESIFLDERDDVLSWNIDRLRELGIGIDVDDFGTGHASIVGLMQLQPNRLKIDRQLVLPITENEAQARLLRSIVEIGKSQNIAVVAEGVETMEHVEMLREMGCDALQGYVFAKPMSNLDLIRFAVRHAEKFAPAQTLPLKMLG